MSKEKNKLSLDRKHLSRQASIEEYLSLVRHELRGQLFVIREGASQVLDGLGSKDCAKCFEILKPALESADKLNRLIEELLSPSAFKYISKNQEKYYVKFNVSGKDDLEKLKNELTSMISHVVRTPLTIIKEGLSLVLDGIPGELNPEQKKFLMEVKETSDRLIESIEELLESYETR